LLLSPKHFQQQKQKPELKTFGQNYCTLLAAYPRTASSLVASLFPALPHFRSNSTRDKDLSPLPNEPVTNTPLLLPCHVYDDPPVPKSSKFHSQSQTSLTRKLADDDDDDTQKSLWHYPFGAFLWPNY
jgi:hypothetical protein